MLLSIAFGILLFPESSQGSLVETDLKGFRGPHLIINTYFVEEYPIITQNSPIFYHDAVGYWRDLKEIKTEKHVQDFIYVRNKDGGILSTPRKVYKDESTGHLYQLFRKPKVWIDETLISNLKARTGQEILEHFTAQHPIVLQGKPMHEDVYDDQGSLHYGHYRFFIPGKLLVDFDLYPVKIARGRSEDAASARASNSDSVVASNAMSTTSSSSAAQIEPEEDQEDPEIE